VPGCRDIVRQGINGILVPPRNTAALAEAIADMLKNPAMRLQMANRGREIAVKEFSEDVVINQTIALYREC